MVCLPVLEKACELVPCTGRQPLHNYYIQGHTFGYFSLYLYFGRDKLAMFTITVHVNVIIYMYLHIDACAQVFSAI